MDTPPPESASAGPAGVPEPPWRQPRRGQQAPRTPLTRDAIVDAALRVLDREGMDRLSMRQVAAELGTGAASLYWHVRNKEQLLQLLFERTTEEIDLPEPEPSRWQDQLRQLGRDMRATMTKHRDIARLSLGRIPAGPTIARYTEWLFALLRPVGIPDQVIAYLGDFAGLYVGAFAFEESLGLYSPTGEDLPPEQIVDMFREYTLSLPADQFPNTRGAVDLLFGGTPEDRFEFGLDLIVRALESYAAVAGNQGSDAGAT